MALGDKLRDAIDKIKTSTVIDKDTVKEITKDIQRALIMSDVDIKLVLKLSKEIEKEALLEKIPGNLSRREHIFKTTYDKLVEIIGGEKAKFEIDRENKPYKILLVGLFGSGKTTATAKLAKYISKQKLKVGMIAADVERPAAYEQLKQLAAQIDMEVFGMPGEKHAATVVKNGIDHFKGKDVIIVDSAGRSALDEELKKEIEEINDELKPDNTFLVLSADIGQIAGKQAVAFHETVGVNSVIITKMDGSAKGGGALTACHVTNTPVYFIGVGEKVDDLEEFDPTRYLSRILGYGDFEGLFDKIKQMDIQFDDAKLLEKGEFNLRLFKNQLQETRKLGPLNKVVEMLGMGKSVPMKEFDMGDDKIKTYVVMMDSMTKHELDDPEILNKSRLKRVAKGSGKTLEDTREMMKQYKRMSKLVKSMRSGFTGKAAKNLFKTMAKDQKIPKAQVNQMMRQKGFGKNMGKNMEDMMKKLGKM